MTASDRVALGALVDDRFAVFHLYLVERAHDVR